MPRQSDTELTARVQKGFGTRAAVLLALVAVLLVCALAAQGAGMGSQGNVAQTEPSAEDASTEQAPAEEELSPEEAERLEREAREAREIVCWGDSMTAGYGASEATIDRKGVHYEASYQSYPEVLRRITGMDVYNFGVSGATSTDIVAMQEGIEPPADQRVTRFDRGIARCAQRHPGDILILEIGSNGGWDGDYDVLIGQYRHMIEHAACEDYIIVGDTDDPGASPADRAQEPLWEAGSETDTAWEAALRAEFGEHFINMRQYLIEYGLKTTGLTPTDEDLELAERGCVSPQLRSDWTHLNSYGYYAKARGIYRRGVKLGYWE